MKEMKTFLKTLGNDARVHIALFTCESRQFSTTVQARLYKKSIKNVASKSLYHVNAHHTYNYTRLTR